MSGGNPATLLSRFEKMITGFGFKKNEPLSLYSFHLSSDGEPLTITTSTNAGYAKVGTSSKHTALIWAATKVVAAGYRFKFQMIMMKRLIYSF